VWCGTRSYGLYLYHVPLFLIVKKCGLPGPWIVLTGVAVGLSLLLADASYRWLERPVMRWSRARA
jgi:peptidoglycan/LPS O-acetylase OafA/YrhL